jgi:hypothetical protein
MDLTRILPEDMLLDVLRRLPPDTLALSRCVCKAWRATVDGHRADLLTLSVEGVFLELYDSSMTPGYRAQEYPIPVLFSRPSTGRKIPADLGYLDLDDGESGYISSILDCCNGLLLLRNDRVVNPATRQWAQVPEISAGWRWRCRIASKYLAFDPLVSPHYEVLSIPEIQWPPTVPYILHVFSSRTGEWEERSVVRQGKAAPTLADGNPSILYKSAAYWHGSLYVNCKYDSVLRYVCIYSIIL